MRERDKFVQEKRDAYGSIAPHTGALSQDRYRNKNVKDYSGQEYGHDMGREAMNAFASQLGAGGRSPVDEALQDRRNLSASLHMASTYLHTSAPAEQLRNGLTHGYSMFAQHTKGLDDAGTRDALAGDIGERREQVKTNIMDIVTHHVAPEDRATFSYPSPLRKPMKDGGGYMTPPSSPFPEPPSESYTRLTNEEAQTKIRRAMVPLVEPTWQPKTRTEGEQPTPFHGSDNNEVMSKFISKPAHNPHVGHGALQHYLRGTTPTGAEVRVKSASSSAFFRTATSTKTAGLHEVVTTDSSSVIAANPNQSVRIALGTAQGSVRTNTALTFFRAPSGAEDGASDSDGE